MEYVEYIFLLLIISKETEFHYYKYWNNIAVAFDQVSNFVESFKSEFIQHGVIPRTR